MSSKMIFVNLPVADLGRSKSFYEAIGWKVNDDFTDQNAACIVIDDNICLMLLTHEQFGMLSRRPVADTSNTIGAVYALALESVEQVEQLITAALAAGGTEEVDTDKRVHEEQVGMYSRTFVDPDGHQWEPFCMDCPGGE